MRTADPRPRSRLPAEHPRCAGLAGPASGPRSGESTTRTCSTISTTRLAKCHRVQRRRGRGPSRASGRCLQHRSANHRRAAHLRLPDTEPEQHPDAQPWYFTPWAVSSDLSMRNFRRLPDRARYWNESPAELVFNPEWPIETRLEHILDNNVDRFPLSLQQLPHLRRHALVVPSRTPCTRSRPTRTWRSRPTTSTPARCPCCCRCDWCTTTTLILRWWSDRSARTATPPGRSTHSTGRTGRLG